MVLALMVRATVALLVLIGGASALKVYVPTAVRSPNLPKFLVLLFFWCFLIAAPPVPEVEGHATRAGETILRFPIRRIKTYVERKLSRVE
jgi:hypothetical protein